MFFLYDEKKYEGNFLEIYVDTFADNNDTSKRIKWERCSRKNKTNAVMIIAKHADTNKYVMISEYRAPIRDREIGFPAGLIEEGESIEETVKREIKEETGLDLIYINNISPLVYNSSGMTDEGVYIAYCTVTGELSNKFLQGYEDIKSFMADINTLKELLANKNNKWGAKAWIICNNICNL